GELGENFGRLSQAHAGFHGADEQSADDVDERDDDAGDGIAADELAGTIHGPEKVGLAGDLDSPALGLFFVDGSRVQVGIDRHLPAGHTVQSEAGRHFADPGGAFGNDQELDEND